MIRSDGEAVDEPGLELLVTLAEGGDRGIGGYPGIAPRVVADPPHRFQPADRSVQKAAQVIKAAFKILPPIALHPCRRPTPHIQTLPNLAQFLFPMGKPGAPIIAESGHRRDAVPSCRQPIVAGVGRS